MNQTIIIFRQMLTEELAIKYNIRESDAMNIVNDSTINKMLEKAPDFIMHYSIEDNVDEIWDEYMGIPIEV